jgi:hypothetical protein
MHPIPVQTTEAAFDLMDEARQLRAQADRWFRLGRFMVDSRTGGIEAGHSRADERSGRAYRAAAGPFGVRRACNTPRNVSY